MNRRYRLRVPLGADGMGGPAWLAHDELLARDVLAQELPVLAGVTPGEWREHVIGQISAVDAIRNAPVAVVHDLVVADDRLWTITDLEEGTTLAQVLADQGRLPVEEVAALGLEVLSALTAAHRRGLLHGNVTPAAVLIAADGRVKLSGFGTGGRTGSSVGVPGFTAPECLTGPPGPASDLWSLGATLYAAVEGVPPYRRETALATTSTVLTERPATPEHAGPLAPLLEALLAKDPLTRPRPRELSRRLRRIAAARPAREPLIVPRAAVAAVAACLVLLAAGAGALGAQVKAGYDREKLARGGFVTSPTACGLLSDAQFAELVPAPFISDQDSSGPNPAVCHWDTVFGAGMPKGLGRKIDVELVHYPPAELARGREYFRKATGSAQAETGSSGFRMLTGLGDEAFAYQDRNGKRLSHLVVVRIENLVVEIGYSGEVKDDPEGRLAAGGLRAARWVVDALSRQL